MDDIARLRRRLEQVEAQRVEAVAVIIAANPNFPRLPDVLDKAFWKVHDDVYLPLLEAKAEVERELRRETQRVEDLRRGRGRRRRDSEPGVAEVLSRREPGVRSKPLRPSDSGWSHPVLVDYSKGDPRGCWLPERADES